MEEKRSRSNKEKDTRKSQVKNGKKKMLLFFSFFSFFLIGYSLTLYGEIFEHSCDAVQVKNNCECYQIKKLNTWITDLDV